MTSCTALLTFHLSPRAANKECASVIISIAPLIIITLLHVFLYVCKHVCITVVVHQEKVHQNLLDGVEHFDKATMKHAETQEKNPLPDPEGRAH